MNASQHSVIPRAKAIEQSSLLNLTELHIPYCGQNLLLTIQRENIAQIRGNIRAIQLDYFDHLLGRKASFTFTFPRLSTAPIFVERMIGLLRNDFEKGYRDLVKLSEPAEVKTSKPELTNFKPSTSAPKKPWGISLMKALRSPPYSSP